MGGRRSANFAVAAAGDALRAAFAAKRDQKASRLWAAAQTLRTNDHFDACTHAAYYSVFHATVGKAVQLGILDIRVVPKRYRHQEMPGLLGKVLTGVLVVSHRGKMENYTAGKAVLELQGLRRVADYEALDVNVEQENGEKSMQLARALLIEMSGVH